MAMSRWRGSTWFTTCSSIKISPDETLSNPAIMRSVVVLPAGTIENYLSRQGRLGGQHKMPQAWPDRSVADELAHSAGEVKT